MPRILKMNFNIKIIPPYIDNEIENHGQQRPKSFGLSEGLAWHRVVSVIDLTNFFLPPAHGSPSLALANKLGRQMAP